MLKLVHPITASHIDIVVPTKNVVEEVTEFHSTVVMNYITSYGLVSLYPLLHLEVTSTVQCTTPKTKDEKDAMKGACTATW